MARFINKMFGSSAKEFCIPGRHEVSSEELPEEGFPDVKDLATLSVHVYQIFDSSQHLPFRVHEGWSCVAKGVYSDGYCGAAYRNDSGSHVVVAHGGTQSLRDYKTDYYGVYRNQDISQVSTAIAFTQEIVNCYHDKVSSISVTGHSLGGWLAQICALFVEFPELLKEERNLTSKKEVDLKTQFLLKNREISQIAYRLHVLSFESPGCNSRLEKILGMNPVDENLSPLELSKRKQILATLDITVVITNSNIVNTFDKHAGYLVHLRIENLKLISWVSSHKSERIVKQLNDPRSIFREVKSYARRCEHELGEKIKYRKWYLSPKNTCRMNIFNDFMLGILAYVQELYKWKNANIGQIANELVNLILDQFDRNVNGLIGHFIIVNKNVSIPWDQLPGIASRYPRSMDEFVSKILKLFRLARKNPDEIIAALTNEPSKIRTELNLLQLEMAFLETASCRYLKNIPSLRGQSCTSKLRTRIQDFLGDREKNCLKILSSGSYLWPILIHTVHVVDAYYSHQPVDQMKVLCFNITTLEHLKHIVELSSLFTNHSEICVIVIEYDFESLEIIQNLIHDLGRVQADSNQKLILLCSGEQDVEFETDERVCICHPGAQDEAHTIQFSMLDETSQNKFLNTKVKIFGDVVSLACNPEVKHQVLFQSSADLGFLDTLFTSADICHVFNENQILIAETTFTCSTKNYIPRTFSRPGSEIQSQEMIVNLNEKCTVIADGAGTGKSTTLVELFLQLKKTNLPKGAYNWTILIDLASFANELNDLEANSISYIGFLTNAAGISGDLGEKVFKYCLESQGNFSFFIDSFDEISERGRSFIVSLITQYLIPHNSRVWITTDVRFKNELEVRLGVVAFGFQKISNKLFNQYLSKHWLDIRESQKMVVSDAIITLANNFADYLYKNYFPVDTFLKVKIFADIHYDGFHSLTSMRDPTSNFKLFTHHINKGLDLIREFIDRKYEKYLEVEDDDNDVGIVEEDEISELGNEYDGVDIGDDIAEIHERAAFIHTTRFYYSLTKPNFAKVLSWKECTELNRVGLCEAILEWKRDIRIPLSVLRRIDNGIQSSPSLWDIIVITLIDGWTDKHKTILIELFNERFKAELIFGDHVMFRNRGSSNFNRVVHWLCETPESKIEWKETIGVMISNPNDVVNYPLGKFNLRFCHNRIAEYLAAKYIVGKLSLTSVLNFLKVHYETETFSNIWAIISYLLGPQLDELQDALS